MGGKKRKATNELDSNETSTTESDSDCEYTPTHLPASTCQLKNKLRQRKKKRIYHKIRC